MRNSLFLEKVLVGIVYIAFFAILILSVVFEQLWLSLILVLSVSLLILYSMYEEAWHEGYESYGHLKYTLREECKKHNTILDKIIYSIAYLWMYIFLIIFWPFTLLNTFGNCRGKCAAKKAEKQKKELSIPKLPVDYVNSSYNYLNDSKPNDYGYDGIDGPIEEVNQITEDIFNDCMKSQQESKTDPSVVQKEHIKTFLKSLTRPERVIVVLYYYEEMTIPEIAKSLELSTTKVSEMLSSIISRCKSYLSEQEKL